MGQNVSNSFTESPKPPCAWYKMVLLAFACRNPWFCHPPRLYRISAVLKASWRFDSVLPSHVFLPPRYIFRFRFGPHILSLTIALIMNIETRRVPWYAFWVGGSLTKGTMWHGHLRPQRVWYQHFDSQSSSAVVQESSAFDAGFPCPIRAWICCTGRVTSKPQALARDS